VFGFEPADEIEPVHVEGLDAWRAAQEPVVPSADTSPKGAR